MEDKVHNVIRANLMVSVLMYMIMNASNQALPEEELKKKIEEWANASSDNLIKAVKSAGYDIVKREDSLKNFPSLV